MSFKIVKQEFGTSVKTTIFELETGNKVNDFCFVEEVGFVIAVDNGIALLNVENEYIFPWVINIDNPKSIYFQEKAKTFYVVNGHKDIKKFSMYNPNAFEVMGEKNKADFNKYFSKMSDEDCVSCVVDCSVNNKGQVYFLNSKINRCFKINGNKTQVLIGDGRAGFSIATKLKQCRVNEPTGICHYKDDVYISDTKNNCVRKILKDENIITILGSPEKCGQHGKLLSSPSKIVIKNNLMYFVDDNKIKYSTVNMSDVGNIYKSEERIVSLDVAKDKSLYVLSELKEKSDVN